MAIHIAGMLSFAEKMPLTSENLAQSVDTNPVVVRRMVGLLTRGGLVNVKMGAGGGACLARKPEEITLAEIYLALDEEAVFDVPQFTEKHLCPIGKIVRPVLDEFLKRAEKAMISSLKQVTLADVIENVKSRLDATEICGSR